MRAAADFAPHVVVTDVGLADATIEQAVAAIRAVFPGVPLLLFSGQEDHALEALATELGAEGFINKADERTAVYSKIEKFLDFGRAGS
jgi:DNA-binding NarL/FixJ family response regulator